MITRGQLVGALIVVSAFLAGCLLVAGLDRYKAMEDYVDYMQVRFAEQRQIQDDLCQERLQRMRTEYEIKLGNRE